MKESQIYGTEKKKDEEEGDMLAFCKSELDVPLPFTLGMKQSWSHNTGWLGIKAIWLWGRKTGKRSMWRCKRKQARSWTASRRHRHAPNCQLLLQPSFVETQGSLRLGCQGYPVLWLRLQGHLFSYLIVHEDKLLSWFSIFAHSFPYF